ncbi:MAG: Hsp33 family molecular chaperone HslO [Rhodospirillales bacterium]
MTKTSEAGAFGDFVQTFQIEDLNIRGRLVRLNQAFADAVSAHGYPAPLAQLIGETMILAAVLASALKYEGVFTLQVQGDGPVSLIMADITSDGAMRAYAKIREGVDGTAIAGNSIPQVIGAGHMAFTVDQGPDTNRYQGITELTGASLAECAQNYFRQSEQLETAIAITAAPGTGDGTPRAAGLMVQRLPSAGDGDKEDEDWRRAVVLMSSITPAELLDDSLSAAQILYRLYHEDGVRLFDQRLLRNQCRCSEDRVSRTLMSFPRAEIDEMAEDGLITVTCEFCRTDYIYDGPRLDALYAETPE